MFVKVTDPSLKKGRSGSLLRFTLSVGPTAELAMSVKGFLCFRDAEGNLALKTPITYLTFYGKRLKYLGTSLTPELTRVVLLYLEDKHGGSLVSDPDWNQERATKRKKQSKSWEPQVEEG